MNKLMRLLTMAAVLVISATATAAAASAADPAIGTWTLNLGKSTYHADRAPKSLTRTYSAGAAGTDMKVSGVAADGSAISQSATLTYDGKDCTLTGSSDFDTLSLKKINGTTVKSTLKSAGKAVGSSTRTISAQGKVLTLSTALKTQKGGTIHEVAVFDRQ